jgi:hypothetical protein
MRQISMAGSKGQLALLGESELSAKPLIRVLFGLNPGFAVNKTG